VSALAFNSGGYYPTTWGWAALAAALLIGLNVTLIVLLLAG
jgi:hypothetical protein